MNPALLVEFLGTALLVSAVAFGGPLLIVAALAVAISIGGPVSGGHFNPAVTAFQYMSGKVSRNNAGLYIVAQILAVLSIGFLRRVL